MDIAKLRGREVALLRLSLHIPTMGTFTLSIDEIDVGVP